MLNPTIGVLYVTTYLYLIILTVVLNILGVSYRVVIKTKYWMYIALIITVHSGIDALNPFCLAGTVYCTIYCIFAYMRLREHLPEYMGNVGLKSSQKRIEDD